MFWVILIALVVVFALFKMGFFRKNKECSDCGTSLSGNKQIILGSGEKKFVLCQNCVDKIHPQLMKYAKDYWDYNDYKNYLLLEESNKDYIAQFKPTDEYGKTAKLKIDKEHCLFTIGDGKNDYVFCFDQVVDYDISFRADEIKEGLLGDKVKGDEYASIQLNCPNVYIEKILNHGVSYKIKEKGFINIKYQFEYSESFSNIIRTFSVCMRIIESIRQDMNNNHDSSSYSHEVDELQKALALFMFDSMDEVTEESLKKQRNALIKAFHPDNDESNQAYSQKINTAYEILKGQL